MEQKLIGGLETPCLVIDVEKARRNLREMQAVADACRCGLRPHIKTHKMKRFARMQMAFGACGITCAKISEAEVMADGGLEDIFVAYPLIEEYRIRRAVRLARQIRRLILAVDGLEGARALSQAAEAAGIVFEVRLEIDTGAKRTGVRREGAPALAKAIHALPGLDLTGIYTFRGLVLHDAPTTDNAAAGKEEGELMARVAEEIRAAGVPIREISGGSTPTGRFVAGTGLVTEIRSGTYIFKDYMLTKEGAARPEEIAAHYYATVVSTPCDEYAVLNGGTKTFPADVPLNVPPYYYPGYAVVEGSDDLTLARMNEEHGMLVSKKGKTGLRVGQKICLTPIHVCTAVNQFNKVYLYENGELTEQTVDARGMLV